MAPMEITNENTARQWLNSWGPKGPRPEILKKAEDGLRMSADIARRYGDNAAAACYEAGARVLRDASQTAT